MKGFLRLIQSPFPFTAVPSRKWGLIIGVGFFVWFFLAVFQPFGLYDLKMEYKSLFFLGYGLLTSLVLFLMFWLFPKLFPGFFNERNWTLGKHLFWLILMLFLIGVGNFIYSCSIGIFVCSQKVFLLFQFYTVVIGLFPVVGLTFLSFQALKSRYSSEADDISISSFNRITPEKSPEREILLRPNSASEDDLVIPLNALNGIASDGNYIRVYMERIKRHEQRIIRKTLKETEDELAGVDEILRVHRGYLVNLINVRRVTGNAQGLVLHFNNPEISIPVSRKFIPEFKSKYNKV